MALVDMKLTKSEVRDTEAPAITDEQPEYPWGLTLHLDNATLAKLGVTGVPELGASMVITARAEATSAGIEKVQDGDDRRHVTLQITAMELGASESSDAASRMYPDG